MSREGLFDHGLPAICAGPEVLSATYWVCCGECCSAWLQANFTNGRVEEFLLDQAINAEDMQSGPIAFCVATAMAHFHFSPLILSRNGIAPKAILWDRMRAWARAVQQHYNASELRALGLHDMLQEVRCLMHLHYIGLDWKKGSWWLCVCIWGKDTCY